MGVNALDCERRVDGTRDGISTALAACWSFECGVAEGHEENQLFRISVPARGPTPGDLALSPVHTQLS